MCLSGLAFGLLVLSGYRWLETPWAPWVAGVLGLLHLIVYGKSGPEQPKRFVLAHSFIVLATVASVILHVRETVGFAPGWSKVLASFALAEAGRLTHLRHVAVAGLVLVVVAASIVGLRRKLRLKFGGFFELLYVISALNVVWDYSLQSVMANALGPRPFLAAAGVFALELGLLLHLVALVILLISWRDRVDAVHQKL